jgi:hypothetical protein
VGAGSATGAAEAGVERPGETLWTMAPPIPAAIRMPRAVPSTARFERFAGGSYEGAGAAEGGGTEASITSAAGRSAALAAAGAMASVDPDATTGAVTGTASAGGAASATGAGATLSPRAHSGEQKVITLPLRIFAAGARSGSTVFWQFGQIIVGYGKASTAASPLAAMSSSMYATM